MSNLTVLPGQLITSESGYLRGHGCYTMIIADSTSNSSNSRSQAQHNAETETTEAELSSRTALVSCMAGRIERVNKLISVRPLQYRYHGEVGDLVVGRISSVDSKRWKVDLNGQKDAVLQLSSVNLPGGVQRMRTYEDQLQMRALFAEADLLSAEVQNISSEGVLALHSRSLKYGKLENGQLTVVPAALVKRLPQHYVSLPCGVDVILGRNGFIWVTRSVPEEWKVEDAALHPNSSSSNSSELVPLAETLQRLKQRHVNTPLTAEERAKIARVCNAIQVIRIASFTHTSSSSSSGGNNSSSNSDSSASVSVSPDSISAIYQHSIDLQLHPKDMLQQHCIATLCSLLSN